MADIPPATQDPNTGMWTYNGQTGTLDQINRFKEVTATREAANTQLASTYETYAASQSDWRSPAAQSSLTAYKQALADKANADIVYQNQRENIFGLIHNSGANNPNTDAGLGQSKNEQGAMTFDQINAQYNAQQGNSIGSGGQLQQGSLSQDYNPLGIVSTPLEVPRDYVPFQSPVAQFPASAFIANGANISEALAGQINNGFDVASNSARNALNPMNLPGPEGTTVTSIGFMGNVGTENKAPAPIITPAQEINEGLLLAGMTPLLGASKVVDDFFGGISNAIPSGYIGSPLKAGVGLVESIPQFALFVPEVAIGTAMFLNNPIGTSLKVPSVVTDLGKGMVDRAINQPERFFGNVIGGAIAPEAIARSPSVIGKGITKATGIALDTMTPIGGESGINYFSTLSFKNNVVGYGAYGADIQGFKLSTGTPTEFMKTLPKVSTEPLFNVRNPAATATPAQLKVLDPFFRDVSKGTTMEPLVNAVLDIKKNIGVNIKGGSEQVLVYKTAQPAGTLKQVGIDTSVQLEVHEILAKYGDVRIGSAADTDQWGAQYVRDSTLSDIDSDMPQANVEQALVELTQAYSKNSEPLVLEGAQFHLESNPTEHILGISFLEKRGDVRFYQAETSSGAKIGQQFPEYGIESKASRTFKKAGLEYTENGGVTFKIGGGKVEKDFASIDSNLRGIAKTAYEQKRYDLGKSYESISDNLRSYAKSTGRDTEINTIPEDILAGVSRTPQKYGNILGIDLDIGRTPSVKTYPEAVSLSKSNSLVGKVYAVPTVSYASNEKTVLLKDVIGKENIFYHATDSENALIRSLKNTGEGVVDTSKGMYANGLFFDVPDNIAGGYLGGPMGGKPPALIRLRTTAVLPDNMIKASKFSGWDDNAIGGAGVFKPNKLSPVPTRNLLGADEFVLADTSRLKLVGTDTITVGPRGSVPVFDVEIVEGITSNAQRNIQEIKGTTVKEAYPSSVLNVKSNGNVLNLPSIKLSYPDSAATSETKSSVIPYPSSKTESNSYPMAYPTANTVARYPEPTDVFVSSPAVLYPNDNVGRTSYAQFGSTPTASSYPVYTPIPETRYPTDKNTPYPTPTPDIPPGYPGYPTNTPPNKYPGTFTTRIPTLPPYRTGIDTGYYTDKIIFPFEEQKQKKNKHRHQKGKRFAEVFSFDKFPGMKIPERLFIKNFQSIGNNAGRGKRFGETFSLSNMNPVIGKPIVLPARPVRRRRK